MNIENYAPVLVAVYNRLDHFRRCIDTLKQNYYADKTPLFIAIDAPYREIDRKIITKIIDFAKNIKGFKRIELFIRDENFGPNKNFDTATNDIYNIYNSVIISEDDNEFSPYFLKFINYGLEMYKERSDIFSICGYQFPINIPSSYKDDIYLWQGFSAWGYGMWKHKYSVGQEDINLVNKWLKDKKHLTKINKVAQRYKFSLKNMIRANYIHGDGYYSNHLVANDMYSVFPTKTYVINHGHDGLGDSCLKSDMFLKQILNNDPDFNLPENITPNQEINIQLWKYFSNYNRLKKRLKNIF